MPTYEFRCPDGHEFEKFYRKISDAAGEVKCPECGKVAERRISSGGGLVFKGSGFYLTDYGKNAHRKSAPSSDTNAGKGSESGATSGGSETKGSESAGGGGDGKAAPVGESAPKTTDAKPAETKAKAAPPKSDR